MTSIIDRVQKYESDNDWVQAFGFHYKKNRFISRSNSSLKVLNLMHMVSYVPIISIIAAIYYLVKANEIGDKNKRFNGCDQEYASALRGRAICTLCQTSIFLAMFDVIVSAIRFSK